MNQSSESSLSGQYRQFLHVYPIQRTFFGTDQWSWVDSCSGNKTIILLPGFMGEAETSFLYILAFARHLRVISISYPPTVERVDRLCDGLRALMDHLGIQQATVLGGSSSGFIAQAFLRQYSARVCSLILTHTGLPSPKRARTARIYLGLLHYLPFGLVRRLMQVSLRAYFPRTTNLHTFWREHFKNIIQRQNQEALRNRFRLMEDFHQRYRFQPDDISEWQGKILIMEMRHDQLTSSNEQASMRRLYPAARVHVFSDAAHYDSVEYPEEQIRVILDFLSEDALIIRPD